MLDTPAFRIDPQTGAIDKLDLMAGNEAHIANVMPLVDDRLLFTRDSIAAPSELYLSQGYGQAVPLTEIATQRIAAQLQGCGWGYGLGPDHQAGEPGRADARHPLCPWRSAGIVQ